MRRKFKFVDNSYWLPECSIWNRTEDNYIELYNSEDTDPILGSSHSIDDCYISAILSDHGATSVTEEYRQFLYNCSTEELLSIIDGLEIEVVIVDDIIGEGEYR